MYLTIIYITHETVQQTNVFNHHIHNPRNSSTLRQGSLKTKCNIESTFVSVFMLIVAS